MAFSKSSNNSKGLNNTFGNPLGVDEQSNKGPTTSSKTIGITEGRYKFSKSSVQGLDAGVWGVNTATKPTGVPGK